MTIQNPVQVLTHAHTELSFWTPLRCRNEAVHWQYHLIQWIDNYFHLTGSVAHAIKCPMDDGQGVTLQEDNQPLWLTLLKVVSYATVIIPAILFCAKWALRTMYPLHICPELLPVETEKTDTVVQEALKPNEVIEPVKPDPIALAIPNAPPNHNVRIEKNQVFYVDPPLLLEGVQLPQEEIEINFAEINIDGEPHLLPVQRPFKKGTEPNNEYIRYQGSAEEALLKIAQDKTPNRGSPVKSVLQHPHNHLLNLKDFFDFLLAPQPLKRHVQTIKKTCLEEILELAVEQALQIKYQDLSYIFSKWVGRGELKIVKLLLDVNQTLIRYPNKNGCAFFVDAVLNGHKEEAQILWQALQNVGVHSPYYTWLFKALTNDYHFTKDELLTASKDIQQEMYQAANVYQHREILLQLRAYGVRPAPFYQEVPMQMVELNFVNLFHYNDDARDVRDAISNFFLIREEHELFTEQQFSFDARYQRDYEFEGKNFSSMVVNRKLKEIAGLIGVNQWIKVPKIFAVIKPANPNDKTVTFKVAGMCPTSEDFEVYAEKITPITTRKATRAEMAALLRQIDKCEFHGEPREHFLLGKNTDGEEGIFFINTDYKAFSRIDYSTDKNRAQGHIAIDYNKMGSLADLMAPEDQGWLQEVIATYNKFLEARERTLYMANDTRLRYQIAVRCGFGVPRDFVIPIAEILS
jgi:hypothetical protein